MYDCIALLSPPLHMKVLNDLMTTSCTLFYSQLTRGKKVLKTKTDSFKSYCMHYTEELGFISAKTVGMR